MGFEVMATALAYDYGSDFAQGHGMLVDQQYRSARPAEPERPSTITVSIANIEVKIDVSRCTNREIPTVVRKSLERLDELARRGTDWDSYGSLRLRPEVVKPAVQLIVDGFKPCLFPEMSLTATGGLNLSWSADGRELEIELLTGDRCDYVYEDADGELTPEESVSVDVARAMLSKLRG
jgi:hypothetical protein